MGRHTRSPEEERAWMDEVRKTFTIACIIITSADFKRQTLLDDVILPKVREVGFDEILVVGDHHPDDGYRYIPVPPLTRSTNDALIKRDVGALSTKADILWYLSDDHYPACGWLGWLRPSPHWDVTVPMRWTKRDGERIQLNNGEQSHYCGGHGIIMRRQVVEAQPWCLGPWHPNWDLLISKRHQEAGFKYCYGVAGVDVIDVEPGARPWE